MKEHPGVYIAPQDLTKLMVRIHGATFEDENIELQFRKSKLNTLEVPQVLLAMCNQASLVSLSKYMKGMIVTDWAIFIELFCNQMSPVNASPWSTRYFLDLFVQLHLQDLYSMEILQEPMNPEYAMGPSLSPENLSTVPPVVCLPVKVPACHIKYIGDKYKNGMSLPSLCCTIENPEMTWLHSFNNVYTCFG